VNKLEEIWHLLNSFESQHNQQNTFVENFSFKESIALNHKKFFGKIYKFLGLSDSKISKKSYSILLSIYLKFHQI